MKGVFDTGISLIEYDEDGCAVGLALRVGPGGKTADLDTRQPRTRLREHARLLRYMLIDHAAVKRRDREVTKLLKQVFDKAMERSLTQ